MYRSSFVPAHVAIALAMTFAVSTTSKAQAPTTLNHQGYLLDSDGEPLDGNYILTFSLYDTETNGTEIWSEDQGLEISSGLFHTVLGTTESLAGLSFDRPYWLGISINNGSELEPRLPLSAVPYSFSALTVPDSTLTPSKFDPSGGSEGQVLTIEGDSVVWKDVASSSAEIPGLFADEAAGFIGVHRASQITGAEFFGVRADVTNGYGGQYVETTGETAWPFYGYATDGSARAWHRYNSDSLSWDLFIGSGQTLSVNEEGDVSAEGDVKAAGLLESLGDGVKFPDGTIQTTAATSQAELDGINVVPLGENFTVYVNRENRIGSEWFGVRAPVTAENQWGGMYMETNGEGIDTSRPFYGYAHNNTVTAWHELNGSTNEWRLIIGSDTRFKVDGNTGDVFADGTFTGGGADVAEAFNVEGSAGSYEPGDVLIISADTDRTVARSTEAYSPLVAGVYAFKPGVLLSENGIAGMNGDQIPMGVVGVVPTKVTNEGGPIRRGDLLVTSGTPGHAMKADPKQIGFGMVLGKALEPFETGERGIIDVLVTVR